MANPFNDSGKVVIPVYHPSGEVHAIEMPAETPVSDFHSALADYYHQDVPTSNGSIENSPAFKEATQEAWKKTGYGQNPLVESGFAVDKDGQSVMPHSEMSPKGQVPQETLKYPPGAMGTVHTHPDSTSPKPSQNDINAAKTTHKTVWVASKRGLFAVDPAGQVTQVYSDPDWMKK